MVVETEQDEGLWQEIVKAKYLYNKSIFIVTHNATNTPIWYDLLKVKDLYLHDIGIVIKTG